MEAHEFWAYTGRDGQLILPPEAQERLPKNRRVRVLVLVEEVEPEPGARDPFQQRLAQPQDNPLWLEFPTIPYDGI